MAILFKPIQNILDLIVNFFIDLLNGIGKMLEWFNPFHENFFVYKLIELFKNLFDFLFIPKNNPFEILSTKFDEKFGFIKQIETLFISLLGYNNYGINVPVFNITWNGLTFPIIDFSVFISYRVWLHRIILATSWFIFIRRTFNKIPKIIGGFSEW